MEKLTLITGNPKKVEQLSLYIEFPLAHQSLDVPEIQSMDIEAIASEKARYAYQSLKSPVLVEDTGLYFEHLNQLPGPFIKWFLETIGSSGLCDLIPADASRVATAKTCLALCDEQGVRTFTGETTGKIALKPSGKTDFGWNNIFIPIGSDITWAEMEQSDQAKDSMRLKAIQKLQAYLSTL